MGAEGMSDDAMRSANSAEVVRRILKREIDSGAEGDADAASAALMRACARVSATLRDALGDDGWNALLARAVARTEAADPIFRAGQVLNGQGISPEGLRESIGTHGVAATTTAIEAVLATVVDLLCRLIGENMAIRLIEHESTPPRANGAP